MSRADLEKKPAEVQAMFDGVAERYDLTNDVLSLGQDRRWRRAVIDAVEPRAGEKVLDLAAGTGTSSQPFRDAGAYVVPCDFSLGMLQVGKRARPGLPVSFPVSWSELPDIHPSDFTVDTAAELLTDRPDWQHLLPAPQVLPEDLIAEGREIPIARVAAMHEGKRRKREANS